ncbi:MAG: hypothetical protein K8S56_07175, partial [Candidatus Cloacimonetes bacterium]|nr:hypothetical protein [Candidatus Cloacimonadota bacterium]
MRTIKLPLILVLMLLAVFSILSIVGWNLFDKKLPAPPITNNPMLNEKVGLLKSRGLSGYQIIAIGSSMTANNLDSAVIREYFTNGRYFNMAATNLKMQELRKLCLCLIETVSPEYFIINSNLMDFYHDSAPIRIDSYKPYLVTQTPFVFYLKHWNPMYLLRFINEYKYRRYSKSIYGSLAFDENAGALLEIYGQDIDSKRYNHFPEFDLLADS